MSEGSKTRERVEVNEDREPIGERDDIIIDYLAELILEADDQTPEEAGYGHGV